MGDWDRRKLLKKLGDALRFGEDCEDSSSLMVERDQPSHDVNFESGCGRGRGDVFRFPVLFPQ